MNVIGMSLLSFVIIIVVIVVICCVVGLFVIGYVICISDTVEGINCATLEQYMFKKSEQTKDNM